MSKAFTTEDDRDDEGPDAELQSLPTKKNYITPKGFARLKDELHTLLHVTRPEITEVVAWAASNGDSSENADYIYGKRRLREIESRLDVRLFERGAGGEIRSTQAGDIAIRRAERIEAEIGGLTAMLKGSDASSTGVVRVTAVPILINRLLVPAAAALMRQHPGLRLELVAEARDLSLARREADIAIRLARPRDAAGQHMIARRIGSLDYAAYAAASAAHPPELSP